MLTMSNGSVLLTSASKSREGKSATSPEMLSSHNISEGTGRAEGSVQDPIYHTSLLWSFISDGCRGWTRVPNVKAPFRPLYLHRSISPPRHSESVLVVAQHVHRISFHQAPSLLFL